MSGSFIYRHHVEPRVKLYSPREESFPIPLNNTLTYPELLIRIWMSSKRSASMIIGISMGLETCLILGQVSHNFLFWKKKAPDGFLWSGWRLTRKQLTSRPDHLWPELWKSMVKHAKLKEKQKWSKEKFHLENARKLRGIFFIDPEDTEFKETIKNARKKLETSVAPAMPCKIEKLWEWWIQQNKNKTCVQWKLMNLRECVWEIRYHIIMKTILQEKDRNSLQHYKLVHKFIPMPQAVKFLQRKQRWTRNGKNWRKLRRGT